MTAKTTRPLCVLSDANVIIKCHRLGIWESMLTQCQMMTTEIIGRTESLYFEAGRQKVAINLNTDIDSGLLGILGASAEDLLWLHSVFSRSFMDDSLHAGELEALAVIHAGKANNALFCSGDGLAIQGLAMLGADSIGISLEKLLQNIGFSGHKLEPWFGEKYFQTNVTKGRLNLVGGIGTAKRTPPNRPGGQQR